MCTDIVLYGLINSFFFLIPYKLKNKFYLGFFGAGLLFGVNVCSPIPQNEYDYGYGQYGGYQAPASLQYGQGWEDKKHKAQSFFISYEKPITLNAL